MAADSGSRKKLTFVRVDEDFWRKLCSLKLNKLGLDDSPIPITGFIAPCLHREALMPLTLNYESLPSDQEGWFRGNRNKCPVPGILYNTNTLEGFNEICRKSLLKAEAKKIWDDINSGRVEEDGSLLLRFVVVSFAELKDWKISYSLALPTLQLDPPATMASLRPALQCLDPGQAESLRAAFIEWRNSGLTTCVPFFLVCIASDSRVSIQKLADWEACQRSCDKVLFGFYDPCHFPDAPGWPLQNYVAYICVRWRVEKIRFFCYRELGGFVDLQSSLIGEVSVSVSRGWTSPDHVPNAVGWQRFKGKMTQCVSLARSLDPKRLAESAAELNLKLMRWRQFSSLNLEILSGTKCLLLGAGTLGCQVARMLMAWGFREITMVDCGRVAMSNPVRQSLYTFDDSIDGGEFKAVAAARSLKCIFPAVKAESVVMAIPMPGHPVPIGEKLNALNDCEKLKKLIEDHHAIFLLTDTRESRWLPSLLCASANKITITAGLGFESFVVMRHGAGPSSLNEDSKASDMNNLSAELGDLSLSDRTGKQRLGCYFCNDVVAPMDSTANRTLDQQCTVTRPGLAPIASALAVELLVGILHHPRGILADAEFENSTNDTTSGNPLGILPHQIRGSLSQFSQMTLVGHASSSCTACSSTVVSEYRERDAGFILDTINNPMYLEDLTGLTELKNSSSSLDLDWVDEVVDDTDDFLEI